MQLFTPALNTLQRGQPKLVPAFLCTSGDTQLCKESQEKAKPWLHPLQPTDLLGIAQQREQATASQRNREGKVDWGVIGIQAVTEAAKLNDIVQ